jgi:PAS domain S-box-containing protein
MDDEKPRYHDIQDRFWAQAAEESRKNVESQFQRTSGDMESIFNDLQKQLNEMELQDNGVRRDSAGRSRSDEKFHDLFEHAPSGYCVLSRVGVILEANSACCRLLGLEKGKIVGRSLGRFVHPETHPQLFTHLEKLEPGTRDSIELKVMVDEKKTRDIRMESVARHDPPDTIYSILIHMGHHHHAAAKSADSAEEYSQIFREMIASAIIVDVRWGENREPVDAVIRDVNLAFEQTTGIEREAAVGKSILELFPQAESQWFEALSDTLKLGQPTFFEAYHRQLKKYFSLKVFRLANGQIAITGTDITEQKNSQESLVRAKDELEIKIEDRTAKLEDSLDALISRIEKRGQTDKDLLEANERLKARAEQLRKVGAELILAEQRDRRRMVRKLDDHLQQYLSSIRTQLEIVRDENAGRRSGVEVGKIAALLDEAIQETRLLSESMSPPVPVEQGLGACLEWLVQRMREKHGLTVDLRLDKEYNPPGDVLVIIFESVQEMLLNVVRHAKVSRAVVRVQQFGFEQVAIIVMDEGAGFDPDRIEHSANSGMGSGLVNIRNRVNLIGGWLHIKSTPEKGSWLGIIFPDRSSNLEA